MGLYCPGAGGLALSPVHLEHNTSAECPAMRPRAEGSKLKAKGGDGNAVRKGRSKSLGERLRKEK
ncbi:hypothetical protein M1N87_01365, partial [Dehalococcoidia bacterium]|nr:hypothetical protein [Dehalococcoidia bacterium]